MDVPMHRALTYVDAHAALAPPVVEVHAGGVRQWAVRRCRGVLLGLGYADVEVRHLCN